MSASTDVVIPPPGPSSPPSSSIAGGEEGAAANRQPQPLTDQEIDMILKDIPLPPGTGKTARELSHKHNLAIFRRELKLVQLKKKRLPEFKQLVIESVISGYVSPHDTVGIKAGQALGEGATQDTLNSKKTTGQTSGAALAFEEIRRLLTGSTSLKDVIMMVYFIDPELSGRKLQDQVHVGTNDSIFAMKHEFEETRIRHLSPIRDRHILAYEDVLALNLKQIRDLHVALYPDKFGEDIDDKFPMSNVLQLRLDTLRMFTHRITMSMVAQVIERDGTNAKDGRKLVVCIWDNENDGLMYVLVNEMDDLSMGLVLDGMAVSMFLENVIMASMSEWLVKGMVGIERIEPVFVSLPKLLSEISHTNDRTILRSTERLSRLAGPSMADLEVALERMGKTYERSAHLELTIDLDRGIKDKLRKEGFHYMKVYGFNYEDMVWREDVDKYRLIMGNPHLMAAHIGISAANQYMFNKYTSSFGGEAKPRMNPAHVQLQFDGLTMFGTVGKMSRASMTARGQGAITSATNSEAMASLTLASTVGGREDIKGHAASVFTGSLPKSGTGGIKFTRRYNRPQQTVGTTLLNVVNPTLGPETALGTAAAPNAALNKLHAILAQQGLMSANLTAPSVPTKNISNLTDSSTADIVASSVNPVTALAKAPTAPPPVGGGGAAKAAKAKAAAAPKRKRVMFVAAVEAYRLYVVLTETVNNYSRYLSQQQVATLRQVMQQHLIMDESTVIDTTVQDQYLNEVLASNAISLTLEQLDEELNRRFGQPGSVDQSPSYNQATGVFGDDKYEINYPAPVSGEITAYDDVKLARNILELAFGNYVRHAELPDSWLSAVRGQQFSNFDFYSLHADKYLSLFPNVDTLASNPGGVGGGVNPLTFVPAEGSFWLLAPPNFQPYLDYYLDHLFAQLELIPFSCLLVVKSTDTIGAIPDIPADFLIYSAEVVLPASSSSSSSSSSRGGGGEGEGDSVFVYYLTSDEVVYPEDVFNSLVDQLAGNLVDANGVVITQNTLVLPEIEEPSELPVPAKPYVAEVTTTIVGVEVRVEPTAPGAAAPVYQPITHEVEYGDISELLE